MKRGFTLIESLMSLVILTIGFSALYYWFVGYGMMAKTDRIHVKAYQLLKSEAELRVAFPDLARDSQWVVTQGVDTFTVHCEVTERVVNRPREVNLEVSSNSKGRQYVSRLYFLVGGVDHVSP